MAQRIFYSFLLVVFALYAAPDCVCACVAPKSEVKQACCTGNAQQQEVKKKCCCEPVDESPALEKDVFDYSKTASSKSIASVEKLVLVSDPLILLSAKTSFTHLVITPPDCARLQVFRI
jgi:hypothetical protein